MTLNQAKAQSYNHPFRDEDEVLALPSCHDQLIRDGTLARMSPPWRQVFDCGPPRDTPRIEVP